MSLVWSDRRDLATGLSVPSRQIKGAPAGPDRAVFAMFAGSTHGGQFHVLWMKCEDTGPVVDYLHQGSSGGRELNTFRHGQVAGSAQGQWAARINNGILVHFAGGTLAQPPDVNMLTIYANTVTDGTTGRRIQAVGFEGEDLLVLMTGNTATHDQLDLLRLTGSQWSATRLASVPYGSPANGFLVAADIIHTPHGVIAAHASYTPDSIGRLYLAMEGTYDGGPGLLVPDVDPWDQPPGSSSYFGGDLLLGVVNNQVAGTNKTWLVQAKVGASGITGLRVNGPVGSQQQAFNDWSKKRLDIRGALLTTPGHNSNLEEYLYDAAIGPYYADASFNGFMPISHRALSPGHFNAFKGQLVTLNAREAGAKGAAHVLNVYEETGTFRASSFKVEWQAPETGVASLRGRRGFFDRV